MQAQQPFVKQGVGTSSCTPAVVANQQSSGPTAEAGMTTQPVSTQVDDAEQTVGQLAVGAKGRTSLCLERHL